MDRYIYLCVLFWRLSLVNDKYQVIKSPVDLADWKNGVRSFLGRSKEGVYFAAIDDAKLRVRMFTESCDHQSGWVSKHQSNLSRTHSWFSHEQKYGAPSSWIIGYSAQRTRCHYNKMFAYRRRLGRWRRRELLLFLCQIPRVPSVQGGHLLV
jgi:hypothetical protein